MDGVDGIVDQLDKPVIRDRCRDLAACSRHAYFHSFSLSHPKAKRWKHVPGIPAVQQTGWKTVGVETIAIPAGSHPVGGVHFLRQHSKF